MHERLRTHAESVAFFGGGAREKAVTFYPLDIKRGGKTGMSGGLGNRFRLVWVIF